MSLHFSGSQGQVMIFCVIQLVMGTPFCVPLPTWFGDRRVELITDFMEHGENVSSGASNFRILRVLRCDQRLVSPGATMVGLPSGVISSMVVR